MPEGGNQRLIITHAVLTGSIPLIPIPIVDDLVKSYFQRRLVRELTRVYSINPTVDELGRFLIASSLSTSNALPMLFPARSSIVVWIVKLRSCRTRPFSASDWSLEVSSRMIPEIPLIEMERNLFQ